MRNRLIVLTAMLALVACGRDETPTPTATAPPTPTVVPAPPPTATAVTTSSAQPVVPTPVRPSPPQERSTPNACHGDGSYAAAVDCFRIASGFSFTLIENGKLTATGEMTRKAVGSEQVTFTLSGSGANDGRWIGATAPSGVTWTRNGSHVAVPPPFAGRIFQRVTLYFDPQKVEGQPRLDGVEVLRGVTTNRYAFTNANSGERDRVWVSQRDGSIMRLVTEPTAAMRASWPATELVVGK